MIEKEKVGYHLGRSMHKAPGFFPWDLGGWEMEQWRGRVEFGVKRRRMELRLLMLDFS